MAKRNHRSRRRTDAKARHLPPGPPQAQPPHDQEAVDGILVQIKEINLTIAAEQPGKIQKQPGYEVKVVIPD